MRIGVCIMCRLLHCQSISQSWSHTVPCASAASAASAAASSASMRAIMSSNLQRSL